MSARAASAGRDLHVYLGWQWDRSASSCNVPGWPSLAQDEAGL